MPEETFTRKQMLNEVDKRVASTLDIEETVARKALKKYIDYIYSQEGVSFLYGINAEVEESILKDIKREEIDISEAEFAYLLSVYKETESYKQESETYDPKPEYRYLTFVMDNSFINNKDSAVTWDHVPSHEEITKCYKEKFPDLVGEDFYYSIRMAY